MRRLVFAFFVLAFIATPAHASADAWVWPVTGRVVRPFDPPASAYGPGHRGINIAARPNAPVRAAADGVVVFAGAIAHTPWVVVQHPGRIRTTYGALAATTVHRGERVRAGQTIARAAGTGSVYFGVRIGPQYVDPLHYLEPLDLSTVVHLAPIDLDRVAHRLGFADAGFRHFAQEESGGRPLHCNPVRAVPAGPNPQPVTQTCTPAIPKVAPNGFVRSVLARAEAQPREARPWPS